MRYALFAGDNYYPCGGLRDLKGRFETLEDARVYVTTHLSYGEFYDWWHIVDTETFTIVQGN
jgi:hypothetical protein